MESERRTQKSRIDPMLRGLGWTVVPFNPDRPLQLYPKCAIEEYPTDNGPADYALCVNGQIVGVVEAKKLTLGPQNVLTQAQRYPRGVTTSPYNFDGHYVPFLYSTNGEVIWFQATNSAGPARLINFTLPLEDAIQEKVHSLPDEQQKQVLEFVENLEQNVRREESARCSSTAGNGKKKEIDLRSQGISREQAADLRARLSTFAEDWERPEMDIYDDYDEATVSSQVTDFLANYVIGKLSNKGPRLTENGE